METTIYSPEQHPQVTVVQVHGDVDCGESGADRLSGLLHSLVDSGDRFLVVDLSEAGFVVSRAIAQVMAVLARLRQREGDLVLVVQPGPVLKSLQIVGAPKLTLVLEYLDQAIDQMALKAAESHE